MSFYINVSFGSFEVNYNKLTFLVQHEVFRLDISIQIPTVMYKLKCFQYIDKYSFGRQSDYVAFIFLHYNVTGVFSLEV